MKFPIGAMLLAAALVPLTPIAKDAETGKFTDLNLAAVIKKHGKNVKSSENLISFKYGNRSLVCIYDRSHNRMRIITPIVKYDGISEAAKDRMLESNFHSALDARYSVSNGMVYSAFIHPLSTLNDIMVEAAMLQVHNLAETFGSTYTSGILQFNDTPGEM